MIKWDSAANADCGLCSGNIETRDHLFSSVITQSRFGGRLLED